MENWLEMQENWERKQSNLKVMVIMHIVSKKLTVSHSLIIFSAVVLKSEVHTTGQKWHSNDEV